MSTLLVQQGPSCWLFVVEAVAFAREMDTRYLRMVMYSYPDGDAVGEADKKQKAPKLSTRKLALTLTAKGLSEMVESLEAYKENYGGRPITMKVVERYAKNHIGSWASAQFAGLKLSGDQSLGSDRTAKIEDAVEAYTKARDCAHRLLELALTTNQHEVNALLNTGHSVIDGDQAIDDVRLTLENQTLPEYASIRKRFTLKWNENLQDTVDFTASTASMHDTTHAVLLDAYDKDTKVVTYKDPNYGDLKILVTLEQFQQMAGGDQIRLHPFFRQGKLKSALNKVLSGQ